MEAYVPDNYVGYDFCSIGPPFYEDDVVITGGCPPYNVEFSSTNFEYNCSAITYYSWTVNDDCGEVTTCYAEINYGYFNFPLEWFEPIPDNLELTMTLEEYETYGAESVGYDEIELYIVYSYICDGIQTSGSGVSSVAISETIDYNIDGYYAVITREIIPDVFYCVPTSDIVTHTIFVANSGCMDSSACNYDSTVEYDDDSCCYGNCGCIDETADNYDSAVQCDNGSCIYYGCLDELACNYDINANTDNGSCILPDGCTEINADNYNPEAQCNDGSCIYFGCINDTACNYDINANTDNGSCILPDGCADENANNYNPEVQCNDFYSCLYTVQGLVFFDENENGIFDGLDYGLPFQEITSADNVVYLTNDEGLFYANVSVSLISFLLSTNEIFPFLTTTNPILYVIGTSEEPTEYSMSFGISNEVPDFAICLDFYPSQNGYPCDDWVNHNLCYRNMGNIPINGILEVEFDSLFQGYQEVTEIDSVMGNTVYMSFENLMPGQMFFYNILLHTPTADHLGEFLTSIGRVYGYYEGEQVAYGESILVQEMTCSYDPNDKQVFPTGYEEPHYVLPETRLEYLVRFQNTGNASATTVLVTDTIDESLDLSSFELVANSHSVITTIKTEARVIEFLFENIMLPDSTINEPESHGLISYKLTPYEDLDVETEINNTANIYFDNNPPIITNTTWTTIYDCNNGLAQIELTSDEICQESELNFSNNQNYIETYSWQLNNTEIGIDSTLLYLFENDGQAVIQLNVTNPICQATDSITIVVNPTPEALTSDDISLCEGESTTLTASGGETYNWNGLGEESTLEVTPTETTSYQVEVTNEFDCTDTDDVTVTINPTPTVETSEDISLCEGESTTLSASGGETYDWNGLSEESTLEVTPTETTTYQVEVTSEFDCSDTGEVMVTINQLPTAEITADQIVLTAVEAETYQWYLNGNPINGANSQTYTAEENGNYSVEVTNEFDCTSISNEIIISVVGIDELTNTNIQLFPNPMQESSMLYFGETGVKYQVKLFTIEGKLIHDYGQVNSGQLEIQRKGLSTGNYLVEVLDATIQKKFTIKLLIE